MKIGLIGNDTSHVEIFSAILHDEKHPYYIKEAQFIGYVEAISLDVEISFSRAKNYQDILNGYGIQQFESVHKLAPYVDAWIIGTVDGRNHLSYFKEIVPYKKPIFIDKPLTIGLQAFDEIAQLSTQYNTAIFSASSLRYSELLTAELKQAPTDFIYAYGPLPFQSTMPGYYWYGIHSLEWIEEIVQCEVTMFEREELQGAELLTMHFSDGRKVVFRGEYEWYDKFGGVVHQKGYPYTLEFWQASKPYYVSLLEEIIAFFKTKISPLSLQRMRRTIEWIEEINRLFVK